MDEKTSADQWTSLLDGLQKASDKKRKQHYVWRHYLRGWANRHNKLYCMEDRREPFQREPDNLAYEKDFYRLKEMSEADLWHVERLLGRMSEEVQRAVRRDWIPPFTEFFLAKKAYEEGGVRIPRVEEALDVMVNNLEENLHCWVEDRAVPMLAALRAGRWEEYRGDRMFYFFLMMQDWRTPSRAAGGIEALSRIPGFNVEASWGLIRTIFATSTSMSLWYARDKVRVSFLSSDTGFITSDQPMTNVRDRRGGVPTEFALYYPVAPKRAVIFDFDAETPGTEHRELSAAETVTYNRLLARQSRKQLYGSSKQALIDARAGP